MDAAAAPPPLDVVPKDTSGRGVSALDWWRYYCDPAHKRHDPGTRARLRRCDSAVDAAAIPAAVSLARRLGALADGGDDRRLAAALDLARVLAHVREHVPGPPMRAAGWKTFVGDRKDSDAGEDRPLLSEARFRRLLTTGPGEEQIAAFTRLLAILDGKADVAALGTDFLDWSHPWRGDQVRKRWAVDYFAARAATSQTDTPAAPATSITAEAEA